MGSEWKEVQLGDLISVKHGYAFKGDDFSENNLEGPIVVTIGNFDYAGGFRFESTRIKRCVSEYPEEYEMQPGEVLLAMTCQTSGGEILGIPGVIPDDGETYLHNQRLGKVVLESAGVNLKYLYWLFLSHGFNHHLFTTATGTKILHTAPKRIESYEFHLPPLPEQKAIAHILGTLDDKIELNRRMNATLEEMAQTLFKSWFVDFDPVIDNALAAGNPIPDELAPRAEIRKNVHANGTTQQGSVDHPTLSDSKSLFPNAFQFIEEQGWIPEGWEVDSIYRLIDVIYGAPFKSSKFTAEGEGTPVIRIRDLKTGKPQNWTEEDHPKKTLISTGDIVVGMDAEFRATIWPGREAFLNQRLFLAKPKVKAANSFFIKKTLGPLLEFEENTQVGTTVAHLGKKEIDRFKALIPSESVLDLYEQATDPLLCRLINNLKATANLTKLRDNLLPNLISGELRISEAEQLSEMAQA